MRVMKACELPAGNTQIDGGGSLSRSRHLYEQKGGKWWKTGWSL